MAGPAPAEPALQVVGGAASGGWREVGGPVAHQAAASGGSGGLIAMVVLVLAVAGGVLLVRRMSRDPLTDPGVLLPDGFRGRNLDTVRLAVGPWPEPAWRPPSEVVLVLLSGGPVPVDADGEIRWLRDGEALRMGPGPGCVRRARPLRTSAVWVHMTPRGAGVEDPAVRP